MLKTIRVGYFFDRMIDDSSAMRSKTKLTNLLYHEPISDRGKEYFPFSLKL